MSSGEVVATGWPFLVAVGIVTWSFLGSLAGSYLGTARSRERAGMEVRMEKVHWYSLGEFLPRYHCFNPECSHFFGLQQLGFWTMVPVLSYLLYRGRCRYCGEKYTRETFILECKGLLLGLVMYGKFLRKRRIWIGISEEVIL